MMIPEFFPAKENFGDLDYILGEKVGRRIIYAGLHNLLSIETARVEMEAMAGLSIYCLKPAKHLAITYRSGVLVTPEMAQQDSLTILTWLELAAHEAVFALHVKNGIFDLHIVYNIVGRDGKAARTKDQLLKAYEICASLCRARGWPIAGSKLAEPAGKPSPAVVVGRTHSSRYAHQKGEIPWGEAISYFVGHFLRLTRTWQDFLTRITQRGISIRLDEKLYKGGARFPTLRYFLIDEPTVGCSAPTVGPEATYESLVARFGQLPADYKSWLPQRSAFRPASKRGLYAAAGQVLERAVEANQIVLPAGERELVLARKYLRLSWTALRAEAREKFALIHARAWDLETDLRAKDADSRRAFRRERLAAIRLLAAHDRSEARALLAWDLANLYRKQRSAAALRWKVRRKVLEAEVPNFNTSFLEFVRRRAAVGEERAIKVRRDHMARGLVATEQGTSALHQRLVLLSRRSATASPNRIVRPITHRGPSKT